MVSRCPVYFGWRNNAAAATLISACHDQSGTHVLHRGSLASGHPDYFPSSLADNATDGAVVYEEGGGEFACAGSKWQDVVIRTLMLGSFRLWREPKSRASTGSVVAYSTTGQIHIRVLSSLPSSLRRDHRHAASLASRTASGLSLASSLVGMPHAFLGCLPVARWNQLASISSVQL